MPIKRTVTQQPKKTVTFTEKKLGKSDIKIDNSFYTITDNSVAPHNNENKALPYVQEFPQHHSEESSEYVLSELRTNN